MKLLLVLVIAFIAVVQATVFFKEEFDDNWQTRWVDSKHRADLGKWELSAGKFHGDAEKDKGLKTSQDAHFYAVSSKFDKFSNEDKTLVIQFSVKHEQDLDCGGGYVKVFSSELKQEEMNGETPYNIMFGPDICGQTKKVHVIFSYKGKNLLINKEIACKDDVLTHVYTLIVKPDNTYEVRIDNEKVESGSLETDWDFLAPKTIQDPNAKKPEDWDENEKIDDPDAKKPENWDVPQHIKDPEAKKPEDWDDEMDGEWEPAQIDNPEYKGEWTAERIDNPNYKGKWVHPEIENPDYTQDDSLYKYSDFGGIGLDLWQVKSGSIFDNIIITDSVEEAEKFATDTWGASKEPEKIMKEAQEAADKKVQDEMAEKTKEDEPTAEEEDYKENVDEEDEEDDGIEKKEDDNEAKSEDHDEL